MKKFKKSFVLTLFAVVLGIVVLAGCGNSGSSSSSSSESGSSSSGKTKITWALWDIDSSTYYKPLIKAFEKENPNIDVEMLDLGSTDYMTVLGTQLSGGDNNIDVASIKDMPGYASLVSKNQLEPLSKLAKNVDLDSYGGLVYQIKVNKEFYALPFRNDIYVMYYNKDLFDAAGVDYPKNGITWDEYNTLVQEVSKKATKAKGSQVYGGHYHTWRSQVQLYGILNGKNTLVSDDYSFLQPYYETVLAQQKAGYVQDYSALKTSSLSYSAAFYQNNVATMVMGSWFIPTLETAMSSGQSEKFNWGIATMPVPKGVDDGTTAGTITSLAINANSKKKKAAYKFVEFVTGKKGASIIAKTGTMPAIQTTDVIESIASTDGFPSDAASKEALSVKKTYLELPYSKNVAEVDTILNDAHDNIMSGNASIKDELKNASDQVKALK